jgi:hypothetical protein
MNLWWNETILRQVDNSLWKVGKSKTRVHQNYRYMCVSYMMIKKNNQLFIVVECYACTKTTTKKSGGGGTHATTPKMTRVRGSQDKIYLHHNHSSWVVSLTYFAFVSSTCPFLAKSTHSWWEIFPPHPFKVHPSREHHWHQGHIPFTKLAYAMHFLW